MTERRKKALLSMVVLFVAFWLRVHNLEGVPPGVHFDEAANGILAGEIALEGYRPLFIEAYTGKEVLFFYVAGALMKGIGVSVFTLRLTAAFLGVLTVAVVVPLGRVLFPRHTHIGQLTAIMLATHFVHLLFSRLGFRAISQPLLQALTIYFLMRGWQKQSMRDYGVSGLFLGLTAYTYLAARLFPILLAPILLLMVFGGLRYDEETQHTRSLITSIRNILMFLGVGSIVLAPLGFYFWQNPERFWTRINQVGGEGNIAIWGLEYIFGFALFTQGDPYIRFNIPDKPFLYPLFLIMLIGGLIALLRHWRRPAVSLILLTPFVMIIPMALASSEITPSNLRAIGLLPFIFFPIAWLFETALRWIAKADYPFLTTHFSLLILFTLVVFRGYFADWGMREDLFYETDGQMAEIADFLDKNAHDETIYVSSIHYQHPTLAFLSERYDETKWLVHSAQNSALAQPSEGAMLLVLPPDQTFDVLETSDVLRATSAFTAYRVTEPLIPDGAIKVGANFSDLVVLDSYSVKQINNSLHVSLVWDVVGETDQAWTSFLQLEDAGGNRWGQAETAVYPSQQWAVGERFVQEAILDPQFGAPPADYALRVGYFAGDARLAVLDEGGYAGSGVLLEPISFASGWAGAGEFTRSPIADIGDGLRLDGFGMGADSAETGTPYTITFLWHANSPLPALKTEIDLIDQSGTVTEWAAVDPALDSYPFSEWQTPTYVRDLTQLTVPLDITGGDYTVRLTVGDFSYDLGSLTIIETERTFAQPTFETDTSAIFGDEILLDGYTLTQQQDSGFTLDLIWKTLKPPSEEYVIFVHILNADGTCCLWQKDSQPRDGAYPTTRWITDEYVTEQYQIPPDSSTATHKIEIGIYIPENGQRLPINTPNSSDDVFYLEPIRYNEDKEEDK